MSASSFLRLWGLEENDKLVGQTTPTLIQNKSFDSSNNFPSPTSFFTAGSNSTGNVLRYLTPAASVATASGEPESNVAVTYDKDLIIKRIKYIIGSNSKNNISNISFRANFVDIPESVLSIQAGEMKSFDSGELNIVIPKGTPLAWKWDTTLSTSGGVTIIFQAEYQIKLSETSNGTIPLQQQLAGLSTDEKPITGVANYSEFLEVDTLDKYVLINGIWYNLAMSSRGQLVQPNIDFIHNRVLTSNGIADFLHWCEPLMKYNKVVVPFSFLSVGTLGGIGISDDGINFREVLKSVTANENFWLIAKDRGDLVLVGSGSGGAFAVGSVYRSQDGGETWTNILANTDIRVYGIDFSIPTGNAIVVTSAGSVPTTSGKILRSNNISVGSPTFSTIVTLTEGGRTVKTLRSGSILVGTGHVTAAGIYRSIDEGATFTKVKVFNGTTETQAIYWIQDIQDPTSGNTKVYAFGVEGRVFQSSDDGLSWVMIMDTKVAAAPVRRIINYAGIYIAANYIAGVNIFDYKAKQFYPLLSESNDGLSNTPFYSIVKYQGALFGTMNNKILYSGKVKPCQFALWSAKSITDTTNGDVTVPFGTTGHSPLHNSVGIFSTQTGTLTVQVYDPIGNVWRDHTSTVAITANTLKILSFVEAPMSARASQYWRIKFVPTVACSINLWVDLN